MTLPRRALGRSGVEVSALGLGCGPLGDLRFDDRDAERVVHAAIDLGVTVLDTAPSYGASEERIGRALRAAHTRDRVTIVTKGGYGVEGESDWTPACLARGVDRALARLETDRIDVFLLHSCPLERLARGDLLEPLVRARDAGKVRAIGYAGDNEALAWAAVATELDVVECSVNVFDQRALGGDVAAAVARGAGVIAKRALGNAPWRASERPARDDVATYWDRMRVIERDVSAFGVPWDELTVRFTAHTPGIACALVGTTSIEHLARAAEHVRRGPLGVLHRAAVERTFEAQTTWRAVV